MKNKVRAWALVKPGKFFLEVYPQRTMVIAKDKATVKALHDSIQFTEEKVIPVEIRLIQRKPRGK